MYPTPPEDVSQNLPPKGFASKCLAYPLLPDQSIASGGADKLLRLDAVLYDTLAEFDITVGNYSFTPKCSGWYLIAAGIEWELIAGTGIGRFNVRVDGITQSLSTQTIHTSVYYTQTTCTIVRLLKGSSMHIDVFQATGVARKIMSYRPTTYLCVHRIE